MVNCFGTTLKICSSTRFVSVLIVSRFTAALHGNALFRATSSSKVCSRPLLVYSKTTYAPSFHRLAAAAFMPSSFPIPLFRYLQTLEEMWSRTLISVTIDVYINYLRMTRTLCKHSKWQNSESVVRTSANLSSSKLAASRAVPKDCCTRGTSRIMEIDARRNCTMTHEAWESARCSRITLVVCLEATGFRGRRYGSDERGPL